MATRRTRLLRRGYIVKKNVYVLAAPMVSFLSKFTHPVYPPVSLFPTFRMSPAWEPRIQSEHVPTRERHPISLLGGAQLVVGVRPSPVAVAVAVCQSLVEVTLVIIQGPVLVVSFVGSGVTTLGT